MLWSRRRYGVQAMRAAGANPRGCPDGVRARGTATASGPPEASGAAHGRRRAIFAEELWGVAVTVRTFDRDDAGYLRWLATHPNGYVINILRSLNADTARLHQASCRTIGGQPPAGRTWTGQYVKVCSDVAGVLDDWALEHAGASITGCGICQPSGSRLYGAAKATRSAATTPRPKPQSVDGS
jgi:hypothetical protein